VKKVIIASVAVALLALSCGEEEGVTPRVPDRVEPTTPANVLRNVEIAFNERDINLLKAMLSESFVFYFDPRDVGSSPPEKPEYKIPESWSYTEFWQVLNKMFRQAYSVHLVIPTGRVGTPGENETKYKAENIRISLLVMIDSLNGLIAEITGWWDFTSQGYDENLGAMPRSLGLVLATFH
jgi:hypothetical protein